MVSVANIFHPELIVVGGGAIAAGDLLLAPAREVVERDALASLGANLSVVPAEFGEMVGGGPAGDAPADDHGSGADGEGDHGLR